ncbi:hypothetical protein GGH91_006071, partial [Coemansia sp. RSA 2671]
FFGILVASVRVPLTRVAEALGDLATNVAASQPPAMPIVCAYIKHCVEVEGEDRMRDAVAEAKFDVAKFLGKDSVVPSALKSNELLSLFPQLA